MISTRRFKISMILLSLNLIGFITASQDPPVVATNTSHPLDEALKKNFEHKVIGTVVESRPACGIVHLNLATWLNGTVASHIIDPILARFDGQERLHEVVAKKSGGQLLAHLKTQKATWEQYKANFVKISEKSSGLKSTSTKIIGDLLAAAGKAIVEGLLKLVFGGSNQESHHHKELHGYVETAHARTLLATGLLTLEVEFADLLSSITSTRALDQKMAEFLGGNEAIEQIFNRSVYKYDESVMKKMGSNGFPLVSIQAIGAKDDSVIIELCLPSSLESEMADLIRIVPKGVFHGKQYLVPMMPSSLYAVQNETKRIEDLLVVAESEVVRSRKMHVIHRFRSQAKSCSLANVGGCPMRKYSTVKDSGIPFVHVTPLGNRKFLVATTSTHGICEGGARIDLESPFFLFDEMAGCKLVIGDFRLGQQSVKVGRLASSKVVLFRSKTEKEESTEPKKFGKSAFIFAMSGTAVLLMLGIIVLITLCLKSRKAGKKANETSGTERAVNQEDPEIENDENV